MGNWVFGCDICQDVCPWQRFAVATKEIAFHPKDYDRAALPLLDLLSLTEDEFRSRFEGSPIYRIKRHRLVRNACVAAGNWGASEVIEPLQRLLHDEHPLVRGHAAWAIGQILGKDTALMLKSYYDREQDTEVKHEIQLALDGD
jgi:epoxyqueuosine reductase